MRFTLLVVPILLLMALPVFGASSYLGGYSGNILTPDAVIEPPGTWEASFHHFANVLDGGDGDNLTAWGITYGLVNNLEVGASFINNDDNATALNAKYMLFTETPARPSVIVGVFDIAGDVNVLNSDPSLYVMLSKNITPLASEVAGAPSKPLRLSAGFGSGFFDGFMAGLDWTLDPNLSLMAEFFGGKLGDNDNLFNAGIRFAPSSNFRLDAATIDFKDLAFGASYRTAL